MAQRTVVDASMAIPLPDELDFAQGALVEPLAVALHAVDRSGVEPGDRVLVTGAGPIGLATILTLRDRGVDDIVVLERAAHRRAVAEQLGAEALDPAADDTPARSLERIQAAVAFDCAGSRSAVAPSLRALAARGTLVVVASYPVDIPVPGHLLLTGEYRILSSFAYAPGTFERVIDGLVRGAYPTGAWVSELPFTEVAEGIEALRAGTRNKLLVALP